MSVDINNEITLLDITGSGTIVATGYLNGEKQVWKIEQDELLFILELAGDRAQDRHSVAKPKKNVS